MKKNQIISIIIGVLILIGLVFSFSYWPKYEKSKIETPFSLEKEPTEGAPEIFSLAGIVLRISPEENYLIVKQPKEEKDYRVDLSEDTEIVQLKFPFDPASPPKEATFTPERISISLEDLKIGDTISVETTTNIFGKTEFNDVSRIQVLP